LEHVRIDLNDLKTVISDINDKKHSERFAAVRGRIVERWKKVVENDGKYFN